VPEEFALDQVGGNGGAVHQDHWLTRAVAEAVNRAGHQLLAGAGLAGDQDGGASHRHPLDRVEDRPHRLAPAQQLPVAGQIADGLLEELGLLRQPLDAALGLEPVIGISQDHGVKRAPIGF